MTQERKTTRPIFLLALGGLPAAIVVGLVALLAGLPEYRSPWYLKGEQPLHPYEERPSIAQVMAAAAASDRDGSEDEALFAESPSSVRLGADEYSKNCVSCHGSGGKADPAVASTLPVPPEDLNSWAVQRRQDADIYRAISAHTDVTHSFDDQFTSEEQWGLVHYLRNEFSPDGSPPWYTLKGQVSEDVGRVVYETLNCERCHGSGRPQEVAGFPPTLDYAGSKLKRDWIVEFLLDPYRIRWKTQGVRPDLWMPSIQLSTWIVLSLRSGRISVSLTRPSIWPWA